jgi:hypothetical protein
LQRAYEFRPDAFGGDEHAAQAAPLATPDTVVATSETGAEHLASVTPLSLVEPIVADVPDTAATDAPAASARPVDAIVIDDGTIDLTDATPLDVTDDDPLASEGVELHTATGTEPGSDWWVPIVSRRAPSRAARPVSEDLGQRRRRAGQIAAETRRRAERTGADATVYCDVHRNLPTELHCARCELPFCEQCLAMLGEPPALHCVDCALELSGVRGHRAAPGA